MIKVELDNPLSIDSTTVQRKAQIESEIDKELKRFDEHWLELGLSPITSIESAAVRTYIRWRLVKG